MKSKPLLVPLGGTAMVCSVAHSGWFVHEGGSNETQSIIVQGPNVVEVGEAVQQAGGEITHQLGIVNAVAFRVTHKQLEVLRGICELRIMGDNPVKTAGDPLPEMDYAHLVDAYDVHDVRIVGTGVTVAVVDTAMWYSHNYVKRNMNGDNRILVEYDALEDS